MIYGNDRALVTSARQAAEALFALKPPLDKSPVSEPGQPAEAMPPRPLARSPPTRRKNEPPITVIIGGRALLMLIAARFSGSGSGKGLLSRAISLIASGLLPFSSFPIPAAPDSYRGPDRPACTAGDPNRSFGRATIILITLSPAIT